MSEVAKYWFAMFWNHPVLVRVCYKCMCMQFCRHIAHTWSVIRVIPGVRAHVVSIWTFAQISLVFRQQHARFYCAELSGKIFVFHPARFGACNVFSLCIACCAMYCRPAHKFVVVRTNVIIVDLWLCWPCDQFMTVKRPVVLVHAVQSGHFFVSKISKISYTQLCVLCV